jgi:hypothetical protein
MEKFKAEEFKLNSKPVFKAPKKVEFNPRAYNKSLRKIKRAF